MVRVLWFETRQDTIAEPETVRRFTAPSPFDRDRFAADTNGHHGQCSYCPEPARTMTGTGTGRWIAFCEAHDKQHRWVKHAPSSRWWYLPPGAPSTRHWWVLCLQPRGLAGGRPGWYLHEHGGRRIVDTRSATLHRARTIAESVLDGSLATA